MNRWQSVEVGDTVYITIDPDRGQKDGRVTHISEIGAGGAYPIITVDVPAYGSFTRPADEVTRRLTVSLYLDISAADQPSDVAKEISEEITRAYQHIYPVVDWEAVLDGK